MGQRRRVPETILMYYGPAEGLYVTDAFFEYMRGLVGAGPMTLEKSAYRGSTGLWGIGHVAVDYRNDERLEGQTAIVYGIGEPEHVDEVRRTIAQAAASYGTLPSRRPPTHPRNF